MPDPPRAWCVNVWALDCESCKEELDRKCNHAVNCKVDPLVNFPHDDLMEAYPNILAEAGGVVR